MTWTGVYCEIIFDNLFWNEFDPGLVNAVYPAIGLPLLSIIILWKFHLGTPEMKPNSFFVHWKNGWASLPFTTYFCVNGNVIPKEESQNSFISLFSYLKSKILPLEEDGSMEIWLSNRYRFEMRILVYFGLALVINNCSLNQDSKYWKEDSIKKKKDNQKLIKIIEKSNDIRLMSVDEYKIYIDDYIKKSKFPDIN